MSDQISRKEFEIRFSQFHSFLNAKGLHKNCPECGVNHWGANPVVGDTSEDPVLQLGEIKGSGTSNVLPVHTISCHNCGYVKLFSALTISEWVKNNG